MNKDIHKIVKAADKGLTYWEYDPTNHSAVPATFKTRTYRFLFWKFKKAWLDRKPGMVYIEALNKSNALRKGHKTYHATQEYASW